MHTSLRKCLINQQICISRTKQAEAILIPKHTQKTEAL